MSPLNEHVISVGKDLEFTYYEGILSLALSIQGSVFGPPRKSRWNEINGSKDKAAAAVKAVAADAADGGRLRGDKPRKTL